MIAIWLHPKKNSKKVPKFFFFEKKRKKNCPPKKYFFYFPSGKKIFLKIIIIIIIINISEYNIISVEMTDPGTTTAHAGSQWYKKYGHFIFAEIWRMVGLCLI